MFKPVYTMYNSRYYLHNKITRSLYTLALSASLKKKKKNLVVSFKNFCQRQNTFSYLFSNFFYQQSFICPICHFSILNQFSVELANFVPSFLFSFPQTVVHYQPFFVVTLQSKLFLQQLVFVFSFDSLKLSCFCLFPPPPLQDSKFVNNIVY